MEKYPPLIPLFRMNKIDFAELFGKSAAFWVGRSTIQRNALVALGNSGNTASLPVIYQALSDHRPIIRAHAAWAVAKLGGQKALGVLLRHGSKERADHCPSALVSLCLLINKVAIY